MTWDVSRYRKLIAMVVSLASIYLSTRLGLTFGDLGALGISSTDIQGDVVDFLVTVGIPAVLTWAFPNRPVDGQETYTEAKKLNWRLYVLVGISILIPAVIMVVEGGYF